MSGCSRVLWVFESPDNSGVSQAARHLAAGFAHRGVTVHAFALRNGIRSEEFAQARCRLEVHPHLGSLLLGGKPLRAARELGVQVVHALTPSVARRAARLAKRLGVPLLVTANRMDEEEFLFLASLDKVGIVAVSDAIRERLTNFAGIARDRIRVIPNGIDLAQFPNPDFRLPGAPSRTLMVGTFGQIDKRKGQRVFLQAVRRLLDQGVDAEFLILGDGPDRGALRRVAEESGVSKRVTFSPNSVSGQLSQLDLLVEPSFQEGLGFSVLQAMAAGVPVVATGVGGLYSLIEDGKNGLMVRAGDADGLAKAIRTLLENQDLRLEMARRARERIETDFSADKVAGQLLDYYRDLMNVDPASKC